MRVTFVYPDLIPHVHGWPGYFHAGIGSLSAVLKQGGHQTSLIHVAQPMGQVDFIGRLRSWEPGLIAFSSTSHMFSLTKKMAGWIKDAGIKTPVICGGIHPTIAPEDAIGARGIDMICRGEGEFPLLELCDRMQSGDEINDIRNLWIKTDGESVVSNPLRPLNDIDSLPFADRTIYSYPDLYSEREGRGTFLVSRGCPHNCTYCCNHLIRKIYGTEGKPIRFRGVDNVLAEIREVIGRYPFIKALAFDDDILFMNRRWSEEFTEKYSRQVRLPFMCNARADVTDEAVVRLLKKAGCYYVKFGIESGNEEIRYNVLNRHMKNEQISRAFALCKEAGIITHSYNIVGVPDETPASILDTIKLNAAIGVDVTHVSIYQPYPGTRLAEICREKGLLESRDLDLDFCSSSIVRLDTVSAAQVLMFRDYFRAIMKYFQLIHKLPRGLSRVAVKLSDRVLSLDFTARVLNLLYHPLNFLRRIPARLSAQGRGGLKRARPVWPMKPPDTERIGR